MPDRSVEIKTKLLGMPFGTAAHRLRKLVMFDLVKKCSLSVCYRCGKEIQDADELSIEHKNGWQLTEDPHKAFFNLEDIGFSHLRCNVSAAAHPNQIYPNRKAKKYAERRKPVALAKKAIRNANRNRRQKRHFPHREQGTLSL
jgi:hypothetical protein